MGIVFLVLIGCGAELAATWLRRRFGTGKGIAFGLVVAVIGIAAGLFVYQWQVSNVLLVSLAGGVCLGVAVDAVLRSIHKKGLKPGVDLAAS
ncbi:MAG: hypothetical protein LBJ02_04495 [Bifidobacteriaceae bacterium]|jgi:cyanate permease|nr:hypothetical protein [Bifidobacteriaceae bacterium]